MATFKPLFNRRRDMKFFNRINNELLNRIIQTPITIYKVSTESESNLYGESVEKTYTKGLQMGCLVSHEEQVTDATEGIGPLVDQSIKIAFHREMIASHGYYPEVGDIVEWNESFFEINGIIENQLVGGQEYKNFSIVANANMTQRDRLQLEQLRVGDND